MITNEIIQAASNALTNDDLETASRMIIEAEEKLLSITDVRLAVQLKANLGGVMIDLGSWTKNEALLEKGTQYACEILSVLPEENHLVHHYYNAANGWSALWQMRSNSAFKQGKLDESLQKEKKLYRKALELVHTNPKFISEYSDLYDQLLVNYANCFDSVTRSIEAVSQFDRVLKRNPSMGEALGNKGITLLWLTPLVQGHRHLFYLESHRLLSEALKKPLHRQALHAFRKHFQHIDQIIQSHRKMEPEEIVSNEPFSKFHTFLRNFCVKHELFLTPTTLIGSRESVVSGDPLFINSMVASLDDNKKFDRYVTFLNQIKQDYVFARFLLVQSQYRSKVVDAIDDGVSLYYPLDYSLHSSYIQMLKTAFRLAVDVLDKIAFFIRDYYHMDSVSDKDVYFRNIFSTHKDPLTLRPEIANIGNPFLFALLDLSLDLKKEGYYGFIYEIRNAITHRVLVLHDIVIRDEQAKDDIPRIYLEEFLQKCIQAMQISRSVVMYLIMMVDFEENRASQNGAFGPILGTPVDDVFRWVPRNEDE